MCGRGSRDGERVGRRRARRVRDVEDEGGAGGPVGFRPAQGFLQPEGAFYRAGVGVGVVGVDVGVGVGAAAVVFVDVVRCSGG